ncbi:hypothetical protein P692DRAFT_20876555 [Suillus brevipes Sb2]|nr:hypothetical protein P692DRAFT_20876555 [Suillus brevipes Sb2]
MSLFAMWPYNRLNRTASDGKITDDRGYEFEDMGDASPLFSTGGGLNHAFHITRIPRGTQKPTEYLLKLIQLNTSVSRRARRLHKQAPLLYYLDKFVMSSSFDERCGDARAKYSSRCIVQLAFQFAIPSRVVSSSEFYVEPPTPQTSTSFTENLGLTAPIQAPGLSERNLACLKVLLYRTQTASAMSSAEQGKVARHPLLMHIESESVHAAVQRLFDASKNLEDSAFQDFVTALCKLSSEMVGMQSDGSTLMDSDDFLSPVPISPHRRRVCGIHLPRTLSSPVDYESLLSATVNTSAGKQLHERKKYHVEKVLVPVLTHYV